VAWVSRTYQTYLVYPRHDRPDSASS